MLNQKQIKNVVMKEFMNELEGLRLQLQNTRDKVGVYLKPSEYAELETKIKGHESQLQECESALKLRTDELKTLRADRDELLDKYER